MRGNDDERKTHESLLSCSCSEEIVFSRYAPFGNCVTTVSRKRASLDTSFLVVRGGAEYGVPNNDGM